MNLISVANLKKMFGATLLFDGVSFDISPRNRIGLVGANGAGKTTLFKILLEQLEADSGNIAKSKSLNIGYLEQQAGYDSENCLWDELMRVFANVIAVEKQLEEITAQLEKFTNNAEELVQKQHKLHDDFEQLGGYTYKSIARSSLLGLGFSEPEFEMKVGTLSGGQKTRLLLAKILLGAADLLLLDEPTNHLDIKAVQWLEDFLKDYSGAFVVISHDRYFLDRVTNRTFELENQKLTVYEGNYTRYLKLKEEAHLAKSRQYENTRREIKRIEGIIAQQKQWNKERNIKTAESKQKVIDRLEKTLDRPDREPDAIHFNFNPKGFLGNDVLFCRDLAMSFGDKKLFSQANLDIQKQERVFLLGPNGSGKTTLFRLILSQLSQTAGTIEMGANIKAAYYDQSQEGLDDTKTAFDEISDSYPKLSGTEIRNALAVFLFRGDDVFKQIGKLSGGEKAKILLLKLMLSGANFLLLDEPTNHLDITSREALESALAQYTGTILVISHDRYFINKLADKIYNLENNTLKKYMGNYDDFREKYIETASAETAKRTSGAAGDYKAKKQAESDKRKLANQIKKCEEKIAETEREQLELKAQLNLHASDYLKLSEILGQVEDLDEKLAEMYEKWEKLNFSQTDLLNLENN
ncbi:MAG: ABC-F family ATP-binding cassette domain-containing protein [Clostridiales bacterium]|jgi:ATP-binding cassette subfamily F protein 3|nr:ABC-F family ATP-binding cassette domain-containing protein [Clostridiales bacterium]